MDVSIKNMVCLRCIKFIENSLNLIDIPYEFVKLGLIRTSLNISKEKLKILDETIKKYGLEIIYDKTAVLIEKIKTLVIKRISLFDSNDNDSFSAYLTGCLKYDYHYLSKLFSVNEGINLHQFIIRHRIEKVKELLLLNELNISEIAYLLNFSNVAHLSLQFKKITGITPSDFQKKDSHRHTIIETS